MKWFGDCERVSGRCAGRGWLWRIAFGYAGGGDGPDDADVEQGVSAGGAGQPGPGGEADGDNAVEVSPAANMAALAQRPA